MNNQEIEKERRELRAKLTSIQHELENEVAEGHRLDEAHTLAHDEMKAKVARLELTIMSLEGEMGYAVPGGVVLQNVKPNAIANHLASKVAELEAARDEWIAGYHSLRGEMDTLAAENVRLRKTLEWISKQYDDSKAIHQVAMDAYEMASTARTALTAELNKKP